MTKHTEATALHFSHVDSDMLKLVMLSGHTITCEHTPYMPLTAVSTRHPTAGYGIRPFDLHLSPQRYGIGTHTITAVQPSCAVTVHSPKLHRS